MNLDEHLLHFLKEFGLILFVYSIGLQVGPGFFSAFEKGGLTLNMVAMTVVFSGVILAIVLHFVSGVPITTMVGIMSANLMVREIGLSLFLACVGLGAGAGFVDTIVHHGGYVWIGYGVIITIVPLIIAGLVGRYAFKLNYYTLIGVLSGATTNPPALAYSNDQTSCDAPAVGYATVYPLTMFLRVLTAQLLILSLA